MITVQYPNAGCYSVFKKHKETTARNLVVENAWNKLTDEPFPLKKSKCGENRYVGVTNTL